MYSVMNREAAALEELCPGLPSALLRAVHQGIAKDSAARPASTAELARMLLVGMSSAQHESAASTLSEEHTEKLTAPAPRRPSPATPARWPLLLGLACLSGLAGAALARRGDPAQAAPIAIGSAPAPSPAPSPQIVTSKAAKAFQPSIAAALPEPPAAPASPAVSPPRASKPAPVATSKPTPVAAPKPSSKPARAAAPGRFDEANPYGE
jgi:fused signal recognition particle receptor